MEKALVAKGVADKLWATEASLDRAMIDGSALLSGVIEARLELNLSSTVGDAAIAKVTAALAELASARTALADAHKELDAVRGRVGIRPVLAPYGKDNEGELEQFARLARAQRRAG